MSQYKVSIDLSGLLGANAGLAQTLFPMVAQAVRAVAEEGAQRWKSAVMHASLLEGEKTPYVESIKVQKVGPMAAEISTDYRLAGEIENGRPARDMKRVLQTSKKVRVSAKGSKYLIIPFRHNTPGMTAHAPAMPPAIYADAKQLTRSLIVGKTLRVSGQANPALMARWGAVAGSRAARGAGPGASTYLIHQNQYKWGDSLPAGLAPKLKDSHKTDPYAGMYRFKADAGKSKSSDYLTFRTMSEKSSGWIMPAKPGLFLAKKVADGLQPILEDAVGQAVKMLKP